MTGSRFPKLSVSVGVLLFSQKDHQFSAMRTMQSSAAVTEFLVKWRPTRAGCSVMVVSC